MSTEAKINPEALDVMIEDLVSNVEEECKALGIDPEDVNADFPVVYRGHSVCAWFDSLQEEVVSRSNHDSEIMVPLIMAKVSNDVDTMRQIARLIQHNLLHIIFELGRAYERDMKGGRDGKEPPSTSS